MDLSNKVCTNCNISKPSDNFNNKHSQCIDCQKKKKEYIQYIKNIGVICTTSIKCNKCGIYRSSNDFNNNSYTCKHCVIKFKQTYLYRLLCIKRLNRKLESKYQLV